MPTEPASPSPMNMGLLFSAQPIATTTARTANHPAACPRCTLLTRKVSLPLSVSPLCIDSVRNARPCRGKVLDMGSTEVWHARCRAVARIYDVDAAKLHGHASSLGAVAWPGLAWSERNGEPLACLRDHESCPASAIGGSDFEAGGDALPELGNMGDDSDQAPLGLE